MLGGMFVLRELLARFDEAVEWPDDPFLDDEHPVDDWAPPPATPAPHS